MYFLLRWLTYVPPQFRWYASYYIGELDNYGVGESSVTVCRTNEDIGIDIQPADGTLTYECESTAFI